MDKNRNKDFKIMASFALGLLAISVFTSLFSAHHWFADLFSHFYIQYMVGGFLLSAWFSFFRQWIQASIACVICAFSLIVFHTSFNFIPGHADVSEESLQDHFRVLQYNRNYSITNHSALISYLQEEQPHVAVIQEATSHHINTVSTMRELYPHQIHEPRVNAFGTAILSRCPITQQRIKSFERIALDNIQVRITVQCNNTAPVTLYAIHPPPPTSRLLNTQRNMELDLTAMDIVEDASENIIMLGDWNITPFSPPFHDVIKTTNLRHEHTSYPPFVTWPSMFALPIFQIPIDHILYKGNLRLLKKERGPAMESDHYPVLATFAVKPQD